MQGCCSLDKTRARDQVAGTPGREIGVEENSYHWIFANLSRKMRMRMICLEGTREPARTNGKPDLCPKEFSR